MSQIPPAARRERSVESYVLLWDVTAQLELPPLEEIPEADAFLEGDDPGPKPTQWQIPGTEIVIARIQEGPRYGEFLFSADTVRRLPAFRCTGLLRVRASAGSRWRWRPEARWRTS